eukprot:gene19808-6951_t
MGVKSYTAVPLLHPIRLDLPAFTPTEFLSAKNLIVAMYNPEAFTEPHAVVSEPPEQPLSSQSGYILNQWIKWQTSLYLCTFKLHVPRGQGSQGNMDLHHLH